MTSYRLDLEQAEREIADIERPLRTFVMSRGWLYEKVVSNSRKGWPDRFLARRGRIVLCELKAPGKEPGAQQLKRHAELRDYGVEVVWFNDLEKAKEFFR